MMRPFCWCAACVCGVLVCVRYAAHDACIQVTGGCAPTSHRRECLCDDRGSQPFASLVLRLAAVVHEDSALTHNSLCCSRPPRDLAAASMMTQHMCQLLEDMRGAAARDDDPGPLLADLHNLQTGACLIFCQQLERQQLS